MDGWINERDEEVGEREVCEKEGCESSHKRREYCV